MKINTLKCCGYIYIYIGIITFLLTWIKTVFSLPGVLAIALVLLRYYRSYILDANVCAKKILISKKMYFTLIIFIIIFGLLCGYGGIFMQHPDWQKHNFILNDLVTRSWPVYYHNDNSSAMLTYYIAQYLIPALCGKAAGGYRTAEVALAIYNMIGIGIILGLLFHSTGADTTRKQLVAMFSILLFGTCLFVGKALYSAFGINSGDTSGSDRWISNSILLQYRTPFTCFRYLFPQTIGAYISTLLFADDWRNVRHYALIGAPLLLYSPFAFVGLAFMMIGVAIYRFFTEDWKSILREIFSIENVVIITTFFAPIVYLLGNLAGEKPSNIGFQLIEYGNNTAVYFCFIATFLPFSILIYRNQHNNILFYLCNIYLLAAPFFSMGLNNDFVMNSTIPAILILMILIIQTLFIYWRQRNIYKKKKAFVILQLFLAIGIIYPLREIRAVIKEPISLTGTADRYTDSSMEVWCRRDGTVRDDLAYNYFTYDYTNSLFYRIFAK